MVPGFRVVRAFGDDRWEAVETALDRRVALLRLSGGDFRASDWPDTAGVPLLYGLAAGPDGVSRFVVTQWSEGTRTFADRVASGASVRDQRRWLDDASRVLSRASHGALSGDDILIAPTGEVSVTGYRVGRSSGARDDHDAVAALRPAASGRGRRTLALGLLAAAAVFGSIASVAVARHPPDHAPPPVGIAYGSALASGDVHSVDCLFSDPSGNSPSCTLMQRTLPRADLVASAGVVRRWVVAGVRGRVYLQVLIPQGRDWQVVGESPPAVVDDPRRVVVIDRPKNVVTLTSGDTRVKQRLVVPEGARFGLRMAPGATVGIRSGVAGARVAQFLGPTTFIEPSGPTRRPGRGEELMLRVEVVPAG